MGWGRMLLLGDFGQQMDIHDMKSALEGQQGRDIGQDEQIHMLQRENQDLKLAVTALLRLLVAKHVLTQTEVSAIARELET